MLNLGVDSTTTTTTPTQKHKTQRKSGNCKYPRRRGGREIEFVSRGNLAESEGCDKATPSATLPAVRRSAAGILTNHRWAYKERNTNLVGDVAILPPFI